MNLLIFVAASLLLFFLVQDAHTTHHKDKNKKGGPPHHRNNGTHGKKPVMESEDDIMDDNDLDSSKVCSPGESYAIMDISTSCCNHTITLNRGLDIGKYWKECAVPLPQSRKSKKDSDDEEYVDSVRRVYNCLVSKHLRKQSTNLMGYAQLMTTKYPTEIRDAVLRNVKVKSKSGGEIPISNYEDFRNIRNTFIEIEKSVCEAMDSGNTNAKSPNMEDKDDDDDDDEEDNSGHNKRNRNKNYNRGNVDRKNDQNGTCDPLEEVELNGGSCCQAQSIPFDLDFWHPPPMNQTTCNATLAEEFKKWKIPNSEIDPALEICTEVCHWKQVGVLNSRMLESLQMGSEREILAQVRNVAPAFLSPRMMKVILNYTKSHNQSAGFEKEMIKHHHLSNATAVALRPCLGFARLGIVLYDAFYEFCTPHRNETRHRVQTKRTHHPVRHYG